MTEAEKDVLRRVYEDELRDLRPQLASARDARTAAQLTLEDAQGAWTVAVGRHAHLQGRIDALKALAAKDGIILD